MRYQKLNPRSKEKVLPRLRRVEGQVRGILQMVEDERYCPEIIHQITAVKRALDRVALMILEDHIKTHVREALTAEQDGEKIVEELTKTLFQLLR